MATSDQIFRAWPTMLATVIGIVIATLSGGEKILRKIPETMFRRIVSGVLVAVGVYLLMTPPK